MITKVGVALLVIKLGDIWRDLEFQSTLYLILQNSMTWRLFGEILLCPWVNLATETKNPWTKNLSRHLYLRIKSVANSVGKHALATEIGSQSRNFSMAKSLFSCSVMLPSEYHGINIQVLFPFNASNSALMAFFHSRTISANLGDFEMTISHPQQPHTIEHKVLDR